MEDISKPGIVLSLIQFLLCRSILVSSYVFGSPSLQLGLNSIQLHICQSKDLGCLH